MLDDSSGEDPTSILHNGLPLSSIFRADNFPSRVLTSIINLEEVVINASLYAENCTFNRLILSERDFPPCNTVLTLCELDK